MSSATASITIVQQDELAPPALLTQAFGEADLAVIHTYAGERIESLDRVDGLVVLGGEASAHEADTTDQGRAVYGLIADAIARGTPVLGICLGAQMLAVATGGSVEVAAPAGPERGLVELRLRPDADGDELLGPVLAELGKDVWAPSDHGDAISALPERATWLASSRTYPFQAFRIGTAWGLQFHPEADLPVLTSWAHARGEDGAIWQAYPDHAAELGRLASLLAEGFARIVSDRAAH